MDIRLLRLFQLISPSLPVGGYAYSQGLESAIEQGDVVGQDDVYHWVKGILCHSLANLDLPGISHQINHFQCEDKQAVVDLNQRLIASRETKELRDESIEMAKALLRVIPIWSESKQEHHQQIMTLSANDRVDWVTAFAFASALQSIRPVDAMAGFAWSWCENQIAAAIKLLPLGQSSGQAVLYKLSDHIPSSVQYAKTVALQDLGSCSPNLAILSCMHETQYSRLFRS